MIPIPPTPGGVAFAAIVRVEALKGSVWSKRKQSGRLLGIAIAVGGLDFARNHPLLSNREDVVHQPVQDQA